MTRHFLAFVLVLIAAMASPSTAAQTQPETPIAVTDVVVATAFSLDEPYTSPWQAGGAKVQKGYAVLARVPARLVVLRAVATPVLYAGDRPAEWRVVDPQTGLILIVVPTNHSLESTPIWFGEPAMPESVTLAEAARQRTLAEQLDVRPLAAPDIHRALRAGDGQQRFPHRRAFSEYLEEMTIALRE